MFRNSEDRPTGYLRLASSLRYMNGNLVQTMSWIKRIIKIGSKHSDGDRDQDIYMERYRTKEKSKLPLINLERNISVTWQEKLSTHFAQISNVTTFYENISNQIYEDVKPKGRRLAMNKKRIEEVYTLKTKFADCKVEEINRNIKLYKIRKRKNIICFSEESEEDNDKPSEESNCLNSHGQLMNVKNSNMICFPEDSESDSSTNELWDRSEEIN